MLYHISVTLISFTSEFILTSPWKLWEGNWDRFLVQRGTQTNSPSWNVLVVVWLWYVQPLIHRDFFFLCIASIPSAGDSRGTMVWLTGSPFRQQRVKVWVKRGKHAFFSCHASFSLAGQKQTGERPESENICASICRWIILIFLDTNLNCVNIVF